MAWVVAALLLIMGSLGIGIALVELLPKVGYMILLACGLYIFALGAVGMQDLTRETPSHTHR
jgi:hypothetical protein